MPAFDETIDLESLKGSVKRSISLAVKYASEIVMPDGHFYGEMRSNATIEAQYIFMRQAIGIDLKPDADALSKWLLGSQNADGSWSVGYGLPGDISTTAEAYLALKILGLSPDTPAMCRARDFTVRMGGIAKVRVFTRINFAMFGLLPWDAVPQLPPELILFPAYAPINVFRLSSWARSTLVPMIVIVHHRPVFPLPNGTSAENDFLDELWCNPARKNVPYSESLIKLWWNEGVFNYTFGFTAADMALSYLNKVIPFTPLRSLRKYAIRRCIDWTLERQEEAGDWAGILPPMINGVLMLQLEGFNLGQKPVRLALKAIERFAWKDNEGMRLQPCVSPVWDTVLMSIGLRDCGVSGDDHRLKSAMDWVLNHQHRGIEGDWRIYRPQLFPGGWSFEYENTWYPDIDDTAAVIIAFVKQDPESKGSPHVIRAIEWILGMQNADGGWAAFDVENDKLWLDQIPFSDMGALCDPSTADVTGRVVEAFGLVCSCDTSQVNLGLEKRMQMAVHHAIKYLASTQELDGSWWGRWGVNYIYGTSNVLCALAYSDGGRIEAMAKPAIEWLKNCQRADGGWGEGLDTYVNPALRGRGESTASQTAWALMGLMVYLPPTDESIIQGVSFLTSTQNEQRGEGTSWLERAYTGTGFPGHFYLHYDLYRHYFPMMALGRYASATGIDMESLVSSSS